MDGENYATKRLNVSKTVSTPIYVEKINARSINPSAKILEFMAPAGRGSKPRLI